MLWVQYYRVAKMHTSEPDMRDASLMPDDVLYFAQYVLIGEAYEL